MKSATHSPVGCGLFEVPLHQVIRPGPDTGDGGPFHLPRTAPTSPAAFISRSIVHRAVGSAFPVQHQSHLPRPAYPEVRLMNPADVFQQHMQVRPYRGTRRVPRLHHHKCAAVTMPL